mgnify:CR=1 FL=1
MSTETKVISKGSKSLATWRDAVTAKLKGKSEVGRRAISDIKDVAARYSSFSVLGGLATTTGALITLIGLVVNRDPFIFLGSMLMAGGIGVLIGSSIINMRSSR